MASDVSPAAVFGDLDANRNTEIIGGSVVLIVLPTIFVTLRLLSRWMARANLWWDDYTVIAALVFSWGPNSVNLIAARHGFGRHVYTLPLDTVESFFKYLYAFEFLYCFAMISVKFSIIGFQYRIFPIIQYRRLLKFCTAFVAAYTVSNLVVCIFQCWPISGFWGTFAGTFAGAKCINVLRYFLISGGINAATDFILLAMPIPLLWKLRTGKLQKFILTGIFSIGLLVCSVSIVRLVLLSTFSQTDFTWDYVPPAIWTAAEPSIGVISACLPSLRPLFAKLVWGRSYRPKMISRTSHSNGLGYSAWRGGGGYRHEGKGPPRSGSFNRLQDGSGASAEHGGTEEPWRHKAHVKGGRTMGDDAGSEEFEIGTAPGDRKSLWDKGIRVKTTVTVTEKVDWLDDLY